MRALVWTAPRQMQLRDAPAPQAAADEILIRVGQAGICGSELSGYLGHNALRVPPLIMGHEFAGEIIELGALVPQLRPDLQRGDLVTVNPLWYCGDCAPCRAGLNQLCDRRSLLGAHRPRRLRGGYRCACQAGAEAAGGHGYAHWRIDRAGRLRSAHR